MSDVSKTILKCLVNSEISVTTNISKKTVCIAVKFEDDFNVGQISKREDTYYDIGRNCVLPMIGKTVSNSGDDLLYVHVNNKEGVAEFYVKAMSWDEALKVVLNYVKVQYESKYQAYEVSRDKTIHTQIKFLSTLYSGIKRGWEVVTDAK